MIIGIVKNPVPSGSTGTKLNVLYPGGRLLPNVRIKSPNRKAYMILQNDGNFVLYETATGRPVWATGTNGRQVSAVVMQQDGNIVLVDKNDRPVWASGQNSENPHNLVAGSYLEIQDDGNAVLYHPEGNGRRAIWNTETYGFTNHHQGKGLFDYIGRAVSGSIDFVTNLPGISFASGQLQDFSRTSIGKDFFRAASAGAATALLVSSGGLAAPAILGAGAAGGFFVLPGLIRGEPIDQAFMHELAAYANKVGANINLGDIAGSLASRPMKAVTDQFNKATSWLDNWSQNAGIDIDRVAAQSDAFRQQFAKAIDPANIAKQLGIPAEVAQLAIDAATRTSNVRGLVFDAQGNIVSPKQIRLIGPLPVPVKAIPLPMLPPAAPSPRGVYHQEPILPPAPKGIPLPVKAAGVIGIVAAAYYATKR